MLLAVVKSFRKHRDIGTLILQRFDIPPGHFRQSRKMVDLQPEITKVEYDDVQRSQFFHTEVGIIIDIAGVVVAVVVVVVVVSSADVI